MDERRRDSRQTGGGHPNARRLFRLHARCYGFGAAALFLLDLAFSEGWWFHWPVFAWGALLLLHGLYVKTVSGDEKWAARRAASVTEKAYDLGHIEDIRERHGYPKRPGHEQPPPENR